MKHQYFGDVNDYRKYGLLRTLERASALRLGVCWMLTPNDRRTDGKFTAYLGEAATWRSYDPELFDALATIVPVHRTLDHVRELNLLPTAIFVDDLVPDDRESRRAYFAIAQQTLRDAQLVFFDPDNGLEVRSCPPGRKDSSKYLMRQEVAAAYASGQSVLIYQHFRREKRDQFVRRLAGELTMNAGKGTVTCFRTANVAFFLVAQPAHAVLLRAAAEAVEKRWRGQIQTSYDFIV
jgi:hypothetical protein